MPTLTLDVEADSARAETALTSVGTAARGMAADVDSAAASADSASSRLDGLGDAGDNVASKSSQATGALGALSGGLEAIGATGAATALQGTAIATDVMSGAGDALNLVMETQAGKFIVAKAQMVASTTASGAQATATGIATGAQWLWNAALTANPIGLVVAGVALFVGGLAIAYAKVGPFRDLVDSAMGVAKDAIGFVVDKLDLVGDGVELAKKGWSGIQDAAETAMAPVETAVGAVSDALETAVGWVKSLIDFLSNIKVPDIDIPFVDRAGSDRSGLSKEEFLQQNYAPAVLPPVTIALTAGEQDKDKAMRTLVESLREYFARQGQVLSITEAS
jgi:hypothetical protein